MKQLPGRARPKWLVVAVQAIAMVVFVAVTISILPALLITSLVAALVLIPVLRQLRKEVERTTVTLNAPTREEMIDITPWHQRMRQEVLQYLRWHRP